MTADDVVQRAAEVLREHIPGLTIPKSDWLAHALHDAGLLAEPKPTEGYLTLMQDIGKLDRLRGEFTDALAWAEWGGDKASREEAWRAADALVAHLDSESPS